MLIDILFNQLKDLRCVGKIAGVTEWNILVYLQRNNIGKK